MRKYLSEGNTSGIIIYRDGHEHKYDICVIDGVAFLKEGDIILCSSPFVYWDKHDENYFNAVSQDPIGDVDEDIPIDDVDEEILNSYFDRFERVGLW